MSPLCDYIRQHAVRGACTCGRCVDAPANPEREQPKGHTAGVFFFKVSASKDLDGATLRRLVKEHVGCFGECDLFDGKEHNYIELGGWVGDQGLALCLMGLGELMELWTVMTPNMLPIPDALRQQMAGAGMVSILPIHSCVEEAVK